MSDWERAPEKGWESAPTGRNPGVAGMMNFGAGILGTPVDLITGALNAAPMLFGTAATALGRPDLAPTPITNPVGGSQSIKQGLRNTGVPFLNPDRPPESGAAGNLAYDYATAGGGVPGMNLAAAGAVAAERALGPQWAGLGALAPGVAMQGVNALTAQSRATQQAQNVTRDATLARAQNAGYVVPPSTVNPSGVGNAVESLAGKAATKQEAAIRNQQVTNALVREELQVPANTPLTENTLRALRDHHSQPYRDVAALSPVAGQALQRLRDVRSEATAQWRHWNMQGVPEARREAERLDRLAGMLERVIERQAVQAGRPELVNQLRESRTYLAKSYDVERALNISNGNVEAHVLGRMLDRGRPLTGNLETIARFAEGPGRQVTQEASRVGAPGVSALNWPAAAMLGTVGVGQLGSSGAALAAAPFVRGGVRQGILSDIYQRNFARPDYAGLQTPSALESILQQSVLANK